MAFSAATSELTEALVSVFVDEPGVGSVTHPTPWIISMCTLPGTSQVLNGGRTLLTIAGTSAHETATTW
jgi:hypothetical protein